MPSSRGCCARAPFATRTLRHGASGAMPATRYAAWKACSPSSGGSEMWCETRRLGQSPRLPLLRLCQTRSGMIRHRRLRRQSARKKSSRRRLTRMPRRPEQYLSSSLGRPRRPLKHQLPCERLPAPLQRTWTAARANSIRPRLPWRACFRGLPSWAWARDSCGRAVPLANRMGRVPLSRRHGYRLWLALCECAAAAVHAWLEVSALVMGGRGTFDTVGKTHGSIKEDEDAHASQHSNTSRAI